MARRRIKATLDQLPLARIRTAADVEIPRAADHEIQRQADDRASGPP
jgi:hypothetical protein